MPDSSVAVTPGTGASVYTRTNAAGEHRQVMVPGGNGDYVAGVNSWGHLRVSVDPTTLLYDNFNTALNTVEKWVITGTAPTISGNGYAAFPTALSTNNSLRSIPVLMSASSQFLQFNVISIIEATAATGAGRFFGVGYGATTPSPTAVVQNGIGFEIFSGDGTLNAVVYRDGTRTFTQALTRPGDGAPHRYSFTYRQTGIVWFIDNTDIPVATLAHPDLNTVDLPVFAARNNASAYTGTPVFSLGSIGVSDWSRSGLSIADPNDHWKEARVVDPAGIPGAIVGGTQGMGLNVNPNAIQKATYIATADVVTGALTANTRKDILVIQHAATAVRNVRIRRIIIGALHGAAPGAVHTMTAKVFRGTALSTAGTALVPVPTNPASAAAETNVQTLPSITAATQVVSYSIGSPAAVTAGLGVSSQTVYDWQESGETIPISLRAGVLDTVVLAIQSTSTPNLTCQIVVVFTEE